MYDSLFLISLAIELHIVAPKYLSEFFPFEAVLTFRILNFCSALREYLFVLRVERPLKGPPGNYLRSYKLRLPKIGCSDGELSTNYLY